jgi:hypothetical protein
MPALTGELLEHRNGRWRTVRLGHTVRVTDRRRVDPLGLSAEQRAASNRAQTVLQFAKALDLTLDPGQEALVDAVF